MFSGFIAMPVLAADKSILPSLVPEECLGPQFDNQCGLSQVEEFAIRVAQIVIGVTGSVALLMFVIGGVLYIMSAGNPERVRKATTVIISSVIGLVIIMFAGFAIRLILTVLTGK